MIAQQHLSRLSALAGRYSVHSIRIPTSEELFKILAVAMVAAIAAAWCVRGVASAFAPDHSKVPSVKVTVQEGDTLWNYAAKYGKKDKYILSRVDDIVRSNDLERSAAIQPGMQIVIPR